MNENIETNVEKLRPFTKILMTIGELPTSYLMSMTYYEQIIWFTKYLQEQVIPAVNTNAEAVEEVQQLVMDLQTYINNYFDNLDVQEEINNKLDKMAEDGTLTTLIASYIDPIYLNFETEINETISQQNNRINNIDNKVNAIVDISPLVVDDISDMTDTTRIYVLSTDGNWYYYDGTNWTSGGVYQSTGVSTSDPVINSLYNDFKYVLDVTKESLTQGGYINVNVDVGDTVSLTPVSNSSRQYAIINVLENEIYYLVGSYTNTSQSRIYGLLDSDNKLVRKATASESLSGFINCAKLVIPSGVSKLVVNSYTTVTTEIYKTKHNLPLINNIDIIGRNSVESKYVIVGKYDGRTSLIASNGTTQSNNSAWTSVYFKAKKDSYIKSTNSNVKFNLCEYSSADNGKSFTYQSGILALDEYKFTSNNWYRISPIYQDSSQASLSIFDYIDGYIVTDDFINDTQFVGTYQDFIRACINTKIHNIEITSDISVESITPDDPRGFANFIGNKVIKGNGFTLTGDDSSPYHLYQVGGALELENLNFDQSSGAIIWILNDSKAVIKNCVISNAGLGHEAGDGISVSSSAVVKVENCEIYNCYDEGISTHGTSYIEVHNCIVHNNGFNQSTEAGNSGSLGGIHLGSSLMGVVENCISYDNYATGICFRGVNDADTSDSVVKCINNLSYGNTNGFSFSSIGNIYCANNSSYNNHDGYLFKRNDNYDYGNKGIIINNNSYDLAHDYISYTGGNDGLIFKNN